MVTAAEKKGGTKKKAAKKKLVIVESPSKAKTIGKFLGSTYKVIASVGHVRDLPKSRLGIEIEKDFEPQYISIRGKGDIIKELRKEAKKAKEVYLATDPDREGEAISWHLATLLDISPETLCRVEFHEITKGEVKKAIKEPRAIEMSKVDAQQARRILDRLVGYSISPLLWRKVRTGLSAGRVQSAALKMVCDREKEVSAFKPEEYWNIMAEFKTSPKFQGKLALRKGKKIVPATEAEAKEVLRACENRDFDVSDLTEKETRRNPQPPFTTSTMQQESSNRLNFRTQKTMQIAQQLYEGIDVKGHGTVGLITYIRTDSTRISQVAMETLKEYITENYGENYYRSRVYKNKKKEVQDAHEAIRPANVNITPEDAKESLTGDQYKLYDLIWCRFVASQMESAQIKSLTLSLENGDYTFKAVGRSTSFNGFLKVYKFAESEEKRLPKLKKGMKLQAHKIFSEQKFTQPPARYTEASLVAALEKEGIGRPSTYASIVGTLITRRYVKREKKNLHPTELGTIVNSVMIEYFKQIVDVSFTSHLETELDMIEEGNMFWKEILREFYKGFEGELSYAEDKIEKIQQEPEYTDEVCDICGARMVKKVGRFGEFLACSKYPDCKNTKPIIKNIGVKCPSCGKDIVEKRSRRGKIFYGCSGYPDCSQSYWDKPTNEKCPKCGGLLTEKNTRNFEGLVCPDKECGYKRKKDEHKE